MIRRDGFVSNSSSSSFVVCIPPTLTWSELMDQYGDEVAWTDICSEHEYEADTELDYDDDEDAYNEVAVEQIKEEAENMFNELKHPNTKQLWNEDWSSAPFEALCRLLESYTIASFDTGPDSGAIVHADYSKVKDIVYGA